MSLAWLANGLSQSRHLMQLGEVCSTRDRSHLYRHLYPRCSRMGENVKGKRGVCLDSIQSGLAGRRIMSRSGGGQRELGARNSTTKKGLTIRLGEFLEGDDVVLGRCQLDGRLGLKLAAHGELMMGDCSISVNSGF